MFESVWSFQNLDAGEYDVYVTWVPFETLASRTPYTITSGSGLSVTQIAEVDQQLAPVGVTEFGSDWQKVSTINVVHNEIDPDAEVVLTNNTKGYVIADGVMLVKKGQSTAETGNLYITENISLSSLHRQLLGGFLGEPALYINFHAENEDVEVRMIQITTSGSMASSVDRLHFYLNKTQYEIPFATATVAACGGDEVITSHNGVAVRTFCARMNNRELVIPEGEDVDFVIRPKLHSDEYGTVSGEEFTFFISKREVSDEATGAGAIHAIGDVSNKSLMANNGDAEADGEIFIGRASANPTNLEIVGSKNVSVLSKIISITNSNPDANGSVVPVGHNPIGQFTFAASRNYNFNNGTNNVIFDGLIFNVRNTNVEFKGSDFRLYNKVQPTIYVTCLPYDDHGHRRAGTFRESNLVIVCEGLADSPVNTGVGSGDENTFVLEANITDPNISTTGEDSTLQVSLESFSNAGISTLPIKFSVTDSHVRWIDRDSGNEETLLWIDHSVSVVNSTTYGGPIDPINDSELTVSIDGPASQDYTRDDNDAVLANIDFVTGESVIDVKDLFIAVQAQNSTHEAIEEKKIYEMVEDVEIRNMATGRTIKGVRLTGSEHFGLMSNSETNGTYQIYRFDDFIINNEDEWEFRVDFINNGDNNHPGDGDKFKINICGEPTHIVSNDVLVSNTTGCTFGGLIYSSTAYQMHVENMATGEKVGDVRPRGNIGGNFHYIASATLDIAVQHIGTHDTAVENAENINLFRFEAHAGHAENILLTKAVFEAKDGSLLNAQNYALWVDTDGDREVDTILEDYASTHSGFVFFSDLAQGGYVIPADDVVVFEVHADIASSLTSDNLQMQFATGSTVTFIEAEELDDGSNLSGIMLNDELHNLADSADINVQTVDSTNMNLVSQGDLFVNQDAAPRSRQLLGGTLGESVLRLSMNARYEAVDVTDLQITSSGSLATSVERLELFIPGESTPFALATIGSCGSDDVITSNEGTTVRTFCANMDSRQLVIPEGREVDVIVRPKMKTDVGGGISGEVISFFISERAVANNSSGAGAVRARGEESRNNLVANDGDDEGEGEIFIGRISPNPTNQNIVGSKNVSVMSKIVSITNNSNTPDGSAVPVGKSNIGAFKFAAATHNNSKGQLNDAVLSGVVFDVNATNVSITANSFKVYNSANSNDSAKVNCEAFNAGGVFIEPISSVASGSLLVRCTMDNSILNASIEEGDDIALVLEAIITDPNTSVTGDASTLQTSISTFNSIENNSFGVIGNGRSHIRWIDQDDTSTDLYWIESPESVIRSTEYSG